MKIFSKFYFFSCQFNSFNHFKNLSPTSEIERIIQNPLKTFMIRFHDGLDGTVGDQWNHVVDEVEADPAYAHVSTFSVKCGLDPDDPEPTLNEYCERIKTTTGFPDILAFRDGHVFAYFTQRNSPEDMKTRSKISRFLDDVNEFNPYKTVNLPPPFDQQSCCEAVEVHVTVKEQGKNGTTIGEKS